MGAHDFAFETGTWRIQHRTLNRRLAGCTEWLEFDGTCTAWELMDGLANVEDQRLDAPAGTFRAATLRRYDPESGLWSIWWWDTRRSTIDPPVIGSFTGGTGTFFGDDVFEGRPIRVRFIWSRITSASAHWEQAFSDDGGGTWETNWTMSFERTRRAATPA